MLRAFKSVLGKHAAAFFSTVDTDVWQRVNEKIVAGEAPDPKDKAILEEALKTARPDLQRTAKEQVYAPLEKALVNARSAIDPMAAVEKAFVRRLGKRSAAVLKASMPSSVWQSIVKKIGSLEKLAPEEQSALEHGFTQAKPKLNLDTETNTHPLLQRTIQKARNSVEDQLVAKTGKTRAELGLPPKIRRASINPADVEGDRWVAGENGPAGTMTHDEILALPKHAKAASKGFAEIRVSPTDEPRFAASEYMYPVEKGQYNMVRIKLTGSYRDDFRIANALANVPVNAGAPAPEGYTWHHCDDYDPETGYGTMELVLSDVHDATIPHSGSVSQWKMHHNGLGYER